MSVILGAPEHPVNPALGVYIPPGSLDTWKVARALHASQLVEVVFFGDSTLWGETESGPFSPLTNKMRALLIAGGYTSARRGYLHAGLSDTTDLAGTLDPVGFTAQTGFASTDSYGFPYSFKSYAASDTVTLRG